MNGKEFLEWCKQEVCNYTNNYLDKTYEKEITTDNAFMVWSCKILQNNKDVSGKMFKENPEQARQLMQATGIKPYI